jgi:hypothetical protein
MMDGVFNSTVTPSLVCGDLLRYEGLSRLVNLCPPTYLSSMGPTKSYSQGT